MSQTTANVDVTVDTFQTWITKTNGLCLDMQTVVVTANSTLGNTAGNSHVKGYFAANTLVAVANLAGGSIAANTLGVPQISFANLNIVSNTVFTANVFLNSGVTLTDASVATHSNTHIFNGNSTANGTAFIIGPTTKLFANGTFGTASQVLSSNGTVAYWRSIIEMQLVDSVTNTSIILAATANAAKTAYDRGTTAIANANQLVFGGTDRVHNGNLTANGTALVIGTATKLYANGAPGTSGQVLTSNGTATYWRSVAEMQLVDSVTNTSIILAATANSAKTAYDRGTTAIANANQIIFGGTDRVHNGNLSANGIALIVGSTTKLFANGSAGLSGQILTTTGTAIYWADAPVGGGGSSNVQVIDSVTNTSIVFAAAANSVKTAYDRGTTAIANANQIIFGGTDRVHNGNLSANGIAFVIGTGTKLYANGGPGASAQVLSSNSTGVYWRSIVEMQLVDSIANTSTLLGATANSVKTAYDRGTAALTAASANSATAYTNATAFSANATNLSSGTVPLARLSGTYNISISGSAGTVDYTNVTNKPTVVSAFTNDVGYITTAGHAFPKRSDGNNISIIYTGQTGQPSWLIGTNDGLNYFPYNPSNFAVSSATTAGRAAPTRFDGTNIDIRYPANSSVTALTGTPTYALGTTDGLNYYVWQPSNWAVASAATAASASSVPWTGVTGRPTAVSQFTNDLGFITGSGNAFPKRSDGTNISIIWSGQAGQPSWLVGSNDGTNFFVYNPANFSVSSATTASSVAWTGVTGRPTDLSSFTNSPGYLTGSSALNGSNITAGTVPLAAMDGSVLRSVSAGYTGSARVFIQSSTPSSPVQGDIWYQV